MSAHRDFGACLLAGGLVMMMCVSMVIIGYRQGHRDGRIETFSQAVRLGYAFRHDDGLFEWKERAK